MQDLKGKISDVKEIETQLAARKAELDAKYQEAKNESKIVEQIKDFPSPDALTSVTYRNWNYRAGSRAVLSVCVLPEKRLRRR